MNDWNPAPVDALSRRDVLRLAGVGAATASMGSLAGCLGSDSMDGQQTGGGDGPDSASTDWQAATLTDVRTDEEFAVAQFDRPVLVETFAVWCSNCKRQQDELIEFHDAVGDDVVSVALNVDPNEDAEKVRTHAEKHGYHWRYAVSPPSVTNALVDEFGTVMTNPPSVPMVLRCPDGSARRLDTGHKPTSYLREQVGQC